MSSRWRCWNVSDSPHAPIRRLPPVLANQIAAGEVVERPAAVVKELLENSLDAGATRIRVDIAGGGADLVRVRDNGTGIAAPQLALALARHATSKLGNIDDLTRIQTLGFRGEALPSIASVARVRVTSRTADADHGASISVEGSANSPASEPAQHPVGTTVEVRDLFFNTPARRRFLRATRTEVMHIEMAVRRTALATPDLAIELWVGERRSIYARADNAEPKRRLQMLVGRGFAAPAAWLDERAGAFRLCGWIDGSGGRAHADVQHLAVNGRPVSDPLLRHAVRAAHAPFLMDGRQPAYVLSFELPAEEVDVNVHPTKHELRFHEPRHVHDFLVSTLTALLRGGHPSVIEMEADQDDDKAGGQPPAFGARGASEHDANRGARSGARPAGRGAGPMPTGVASQPHPLAGGLRGVSDSGAVYRPQNRRVGAWRRELAPGYVLTEAAETLFVVSTGRLGAACVKAAGNFHDVPLEVSTDRHEPGPGADLSAAWTPHPLLLPHPWSLSDKRAAQVLSETDAMARRGITVRQAAPEEVMVLTVPRLLAGLPTSLFIEGLERWCASGALPERFDDELAAIAFSAACSVNQEIVERWLAYCPVDLDLSEVARPLDTESLREWFGD